MARQGRPGVRDNARKIKKGVKASKETSSQRGCYCCGGDDGDDIKSRRTRTGSISTSIDKS